MADKSKLVLNIYLRFLPILLCCIGKSTYMRAYSTTYVVEDKYAKDSEKVDATRKSIGQYPINVQ